ncbi:MAG: DUF4203 domain-containing protein [Eubacteriales bacterium]|nr:DUF4203 domain-containing protein [Eubacteriales bacterium]
MDLSLILMIGGIAAAVVALVFCFFGYRFSRLLLPICGVLLFEGGQYILIYDMLELNELSTWFFFCGSCVAIYILLFFFKRIAGFFTGLMGSALFLLYAVYALDLHGIVYVYPACFTICVVVGLLTVVYKRVGVIVSTSLFGACVAVYIGLYLQFEGIHSLTMYDNVLLPLEQYLSANAYLIAGVSLGLAAIGILVQLFVTARRQVLSGGHDEDKGRVPRKRKKTGNTEYFVESGDTGTGGKTLGYWDDGV